MKEKLAIFDLDDTLIRGDSFRALIVSHAFWHPKLILLLGLRVLKILGRKQFAEQAHAVLRRKLNSEKFVQSLVFKLENKLDARVWANAQCRMEDGQKLVLISASPDEYVSVLAKKLGFSAGHGSFWRGGKYQHLHGRGKLTFAETTYPKSRYDWYYGISDSQSDADLLAACAEEKLWQGHG